MFIPHILSRTVSSNYQINTIVNIEIGKLVICVENYCLHSFYQNRELFPSKSPIDQVVSDLKNGKTIIITNDPEREDEGDIVIAAEKVTEEVISFMVKKAPGSVCLSTTQVWYPYQ